MDLHTNASDLLEIDDRGFLFFSGKNYQRFIKNSTGLDLLKQIINGFGALSAKAQNLKQIITTLLKFSGSDQRIYMKIKGEKALGFVRVGEKALFYRDYLGNFKQIYPTCVLDFYVHQSCQRNGLGKEIFDKFLENEKKQPRKLGYDRPSPKLTNFLKKHYSLAKYVPQNNNFVVFDAFFSDGQRMVHSDKKIQEMNILQKKYSQPIDSLEVFRKEMEIVQFEKNKAKDQKVKQLAFNTPWAVKDEKLIFRTTANTYGSYYRYR